MPQRILQAGAVSGTRRKKAGGAEGRAGHRPPNFLGRVGICRASKVDSPGLSGS